MRMRGDDTRIAIRRVTVQMAVPVHGMCCQRPNGSCSIGCNMQTAEFLVDLDTKECKGHVLDGSVLVEPKFWSWVCARVYEEVRAKLEGTLAFEASHRIVLDPYQNRNGFGEWSS